MSEVLRSEFRFCFQKMLRQAGIVKGMAIDPLYVKKKKKYKLTEKYLLTKNSKKIKKNNLIEEFKEKI